MEAQDVLFYKGINSDMDKIYLSGDTYIDLVNGMLVPSENGKYIVKNANGTKELFSITSGYTPIGFVVIAGILYIVSCNEQSITEVGCYPYFSNGTKTYSYQPLQNYVATVTPGPMRSNLFGYTKTSNVSVIGRLTFDGSVNLYLCDGVNPNWVINTGFDQRGDSNNFLYYPSSFFGRLRFFMSASKIPLFDMASCLIQDGGMLKPGSYIVFIRYMDQHYNKTPFIGYSEAFLVSNGETGSYSPVPFSDNDTAVTNKQIKLVLNNLETTEYKYVEIAYLRSFGLAGSVTTETKLISSVIDKGTSGSLTIILNGNEKLATLTIEELYQQIPQTQTSTDHVVANDRYWGVGWKKKQREGEFTKNFFRRILPSPTEVPMASHLGLQIGKADQVGYFAEQIYQFMGQFIYNDMSTSKLYPLAGRKDTTTESFNNSGFVKMPIRSSYNYPIGIIFNAERDSHSYFGDMSHQGGNPISAKNYFEYYITNDEFKDVIGVRFYRSKRVNNLLYQGLMVPTTFRFKKQSYLYPKTGTSHTVNGLTFDHTMWLQLDRVGPEGTYDKYLGKASAPQSYKGAMHYPFFCGIAPGYQINNYGRPPWALQSIFTLNSTEHIRFAMFSPDYMFNNVAKITQGQTLYYEEVRTSNVSKPAADFDSDGIFPNYPRVVYDATSITYNNRKSGKVVAHAVELNTDRGPGNYSSQIRDYFAIGRNKDALAIRTAIAYQDDHDNAEDHHGCLRSNRCPAFIGIEILDETYNDGHLVENARYANLYLSPNDGDFYDAVIQKQNLAESYYIIEQPFASTSFGNLDSHAFMGGDCFLNTMNFFLNKTFEFGGDDTAGDLELWNKHWGALNAASFGDGQYGHKYHHGVLAKITCESELNANARIATKDATFFDALGLSHSMGNYVKIVKSSSKDICKESFLNYGGLSKVSVVYQVGSNSFVSDYDKDSYNSSVLVSDKQQGDAIADSFRKITFTKLKSFAMTLGGIEAIRCLNDQIFLIHRYGTTLHQTEMIIKQTQDNNPITIAQGEVLPETYLYIGKYGAQSKGAIAQSDIALYGFDKERERPWMVKGTSGGYQQIDMVEEFNAKKLFDGYIDFLKEYNTSPISMVNLGYDASRNEIHFSTLLTGGDKMTFIFNEKINAFIGRQEYFANRLIGFLNEMLSTIYNNQNDMNVVFQHNSYQKSDLQTFHNSKKTFRFVFTVNGKGEKDYSRVPKIHESLQFHSSREPFSTIKFSTEHQEGTYSSFYDEARDDFWNNPEWKENSWRVPVLVQNSAKANIGPIIPTTNPLLDVFGYDPNAAQRGTWLEIQVEYSGSEEIYIKNVTSYFNTSQS